MARIFVSRILVIALFTFDLIDSLLVPHSSVAVRLHSQVGKKSNKSKQGLRMTSHANDASAYHEMVSSAVDFNSVYSRNGVVTGEFVVMKNYCCALISENRFLLLLSCPAIRSVRDIDTSSRRQLIYNLPISSNVGDSSSSRWVAPPIELPTKIKARIPSPTGSKIAVLVEEVASTAGGTNNATNKRFAFEIWTNDGHRLANRVVLPAEKHGSVCTDFAWFGGVSWSPDELALVYAAELNKPKTTTFFASPPSPKTDENAIVGAQHVLGIGKGEDWGEKYETTALLGLFCLNVETGKVGGIENVPGFVATDANCMEGGYVLGQPSFSPCGSSVVYSGWDAGAGGDMPRRLGAIYCFHRPCKIYVSPVTDLLSQLANPINRDDEKTPESDLSYTCITPDDRLARSPRFSKPKGGLSKLAYLCNTKGFDTHGGCMALHVIDWDMAKGTVIDESRKVVVDVVQFPGDRGDKVEVSGINFPGLFLNQLRDDCFSPDGNYILTTTEWGSVNKIVAISLGDGVVSPIHFDLSTSDAFSDSAAQQFLCFTDSGGAIVTQSEPNRPTMLGCLQPSFLEELSIVAPSQLLADMSAVASTSHSSLKSEITMGIRYQLLNIHPNHGDVKVPVGSVLLVPDDAGGEKLPLIVVPHGGPHTCMSTSYFPSYAFLCKHGRYAILHVNFRGSTGFGQAALESLAGNAGSLDVLDVVAATQSVIDAGIVDPDRVGICGGSHGKLSIKCDACILEGGFIQDFVPL